MRNRRGLRLRGRHHRGYRHGHRGRCCRRSRRRSDGRCRELGGRRCRMAGHERSASRSTSSTRPAIGSAWFGAQYAAVRELAIALSAAVPPRGRAHAVVRQDLRMLAHSAFVALPLAMLLTFAAVTLVELGLALTDWMTAQALACFGRDAAERSLEQLAELLQPSALTGSPLPGLVVFLVRGADGRARAPRVDRARAARGVHLRRGELPPVSPRGAGVATDRPAGRDDCASGSARSSLRSSRSRRRSRSPARRSRTVVGGERRPDGAARRLRRAARRCAHAVGAAADAARLDERRSRASTEAWCGRQRARRRAPPRRRWSPAGHAALVRAGSGQAARPARGRPRRRAAASAAARRPARQSGGPQARPPCPP